MNSHLSSLMKIMRNIDGIGKYEMIKKDEMNENKLDRFNKFCKKFSLKLVPESSVNRF